LSPEGPPRGVALGISERTQVEAVQVFKLVSGLAAEEMMQELVKEVVEGLFFVN